METYRILKSGYRFKIQNPDDSVEENWDEDFLLVINFSQVDDLEPRLLG